MTTAPVGVERRVGQRFPFLLPVSFRVSATGVAGVGCTQDLSSRGAFFLSSASLREGDEIELTLTMPSEITLGQSMRVRCRGRILRLLNLPENAPPNVSPGIMGERAGAATPCAAEHKIAVAVRLDGYEYLSDSLEAFPRVSLPDPPRKEESTDFLPPHP